MEEAAEAGGGGASCGLVAELALCSGLHRGGGTSTASSGETNPGQQFLLHVEVQSIFQIDVEVEEPETSENPTQSFEIHSVSAFAP